MNLMKNSKINPRLCSDCKCADRTVKYSDWHYCSNPKDFRDFTIIRSFTLLGERIDKITPPEWCPNK